ncbi:peptidoglycan DD-metalloendopeptidase family protein [candidate division WWE3 bacterium]|nr:peptidoglycan DD-metalloendopeptidase family protein [candidate division WWE3 bacterium]
MQKRGWVSNTSHFIATLLAFYLEIYVGFVQIRTEVQASEVWTKTSLNSSHIETLEVTPWGVLAGEKDPRLQLFPYNGIYQSKDFGKTWLQFALKNKGINSIKHNNKKLYATTYYSVGGENGLFISEDGGKTWFQKGPKVSTSKIEALDNKLLLGTYSHGLWLSNDGGINWQQKIGDGYTGPQIYAILLKENFALASLATSTFVSTDNLQTWQEVTQLKNLRVRNFTKLGDYIFAGTDNTSGIWVTINPSVGWTQNQSWGNKASDFVTNFRDVLYSANNGEVFKSYDYGETWLTTNLIKPTNRISSIAGVYKEIPIILSSLVTEGTFTTNYVAFFGPQKFLGIPWDFLNTDELIKKLYSFFDHELPLLGYAGLIELEDIKNTTLNFFGVKNKQPEMYYSSHDGIDFALPFGTPILAAYNGVGVYNFDRLGFGHYITVTHPNGYKTIYAHLQKDGLISSVAGEEVIVAKGSVLGKVGMSGNTTGPHLHFAIQKLDTPRPENRIDPFGWIAHNLTDPWANLSWQDVNGNHTGPKSYNLWATEGLPYTNDSIVTISSDTEITDNSASIFVRSYSIPIKNTYNEKLEYVNGSSTLIELVNILGETIHLLSKKIKLTFDLANLDLSKIDVRSLRVYSFDESAGKWQGLTSLFNPETKTIETEVDHLSWFAVFGVLEESWQKTLVLEDGSFNIAITE